MSRRNLHSLLLAVLWIVLAGGTYSFVWGHRLPAAETLEADLARRTADHEALRALASRRGAFADSLAAAQQALRSSPKAVLAEENSKVTFAYLNRLATVEGRHLRLSMATGRRHEGERVRSTSYLVEGEAPFAHLHAFLWKLEHYKRLYTIESLQWQEVTRSDGRDAAPRSLVRFRIALTGYGTGSRWNADSTLVDTAAAPELSHNPFLPLVRDYIPPNTEDLLDVDRARLQGLTEDRAFVLDHRQQLQVLREGDRVYLGLLTDIDKDGRYAAFTLNKGGFVEKVVLRLAARR